MSASITINYAGVKKSVEKVVVDVKTKVITEFDAYVKDNVDEESYEAMKELFEGFQQKLASVAIKLEEETTTKAFLGKKGAKNKSAEPKVKKALSAYNIFIKETIESLKKENPAMKGQELMKAATDAWKNKKAAGAIA